MELNYFTGIGRRAVNEDVLCIERISSGCDLYMVIDGMGGHEKGDEAAKIVADRILTFLKHSKGPINETVLQKAVQKANLAIKHFNLENKIQSGAAVAGVVVCQDFNHIFWLGDVKVYCLEKGDLAFESKSHTLFDSLQESNHDFNNENLNKYKHVLTRSVSGKTKEAEIGYQRLVKEKNEIIICSDGVHDLLGLLELRQLLSTGDLEEFLLENAEDNYSLIYGRF